MVAGKTCSTAGRRGTGYIGRRMGLPVGAIEPAFRRAFFDGLGMSPDIAAASDAPGGWPVIRKEVERILQQRDPDHWCQACASREACVTPVASLDEVQQDAAFALRGSLADNPAGGGLKRPALAPLLLAPK